jgi:site-specific DNA recombinase
MHTYFGYIRVSTAKQTLGVSLEEQRAAIIRFAQDRTIKIGEWFVDIETAATVGRPAFARMIRGLRLGKTAGLVVHKIDRSARNFRDWAHIGELADRGHQRYQSQGVIHHALEIVGRASLSLYSLTYLKD